MDHMNNIVEAQPAEATRAIGAWTASEETKNFAYLIMMCHALQSKMIEYYNAGYMPADSRDERPQRLVEIREQLKSIVLRDDAGHIFTIAPTRDESGTLRCGGNLKLVGEVCMNTSPPPPPG